MGWRSDCMSQHLFQDLPRGWWGRKAEGIGQISGSVPFCVWLWKLELWGCMSMWGRQARCISLRMAVHTWFLSGSSCFLSCCVCWCTSSISCFLEKKKNVCALWCWVIYDGDDLRILHSWLWWMWDISLDPWASLSPFSEPRKPWQWATAQICINVFLGPSLISLSPK